MGEPKGEGDLPAGSPCGAGGPGMGGRSAGNYFSFAYSALASFRMGMSESASFQIVRKS
jgi:hypothetical protein